MDLRDVESELRAGEANTFGPHDGPTMTMHGIGAKMGLLAVLFFCGGLFGWNHFSERAEQLKKDYPQMAAAQTARASGTEKPLEQMTSAEKVEYVRRMLAEQRERRDWNWTSPSWSRGINYPIFAWFLFLLSAGFLFLPGDFCVKWLAPICVVLEGVAMGSMEVLTHERYPGVTLLSLLLTAGLLLSCAGVLWTGVLDDRNLPALLGTGIAGSIAFTYAATLVFSSLGYPIPFFKLSAGYWMSTAAITIAINAFFVMAWCAAIRKDIERGAPRNMEWRAALRIFVELLYHLRWLRVVVRQQNRRSSAMIR